MVARDKAHDSRRPTFDLRLRRATARVVEVESEGRLASRKALADGWRETTQQNTGDAVPELRARRLPAVMQQSGEDQLFIRAQLA